MLLTEIYRNLLLENLLDNFKEKYVGEGKPLSEKLFQDIVKVTNDKLQYTLWIAKNIKDKNLLPEDVYKFGDTMEDSKLSPGYITIFEKNKRLYPLKDINQYNSKQLIQDFINKSIEIRDKDIKIEKTSESGETFVSPKDIKKLDEVGIKFHGMVEGYQLFEIPYEVKDSDEAFKRYKDILGRCAGRAQGQKIDICTFIQENFTYYFNRHPGSKYFVLFNMSDNLSPYQIHYESGQFKDRADHEIRDTNVEIKHLKILKFLQNLYPKKFPNINQSLLLSNVTEKNFDKNGKLNGVFFNYESLSSGEEITREITYKNGKKNGPETEITRELINNTIVGKKITNYVDSVKEGFEIEYGYDSGYDSNYEEHIMYKNNVKNGPYFIKLENGVIIERGQYKNNDKVGITKYYYKTGELQSTYFKDHVGFHYTTHYKDGTLRSETTRYSVGGRGQYGKFYNNEGNYMLVRDENHTHIYDEKNEKIIQYSPHVINFLQYDFRITKHSMEDTFVIDFNNGSKLIHAADYLMKQSGEGTKNVNLSDYERIQLLQPLRKIFNDLSKFREGLNTEDWKIFLHFYELAVKQIKNLMR